MREPPLMVGHVLRRPCADCPFRIGKGHQFRLRRVSEILSGSGFACHKTLDYAEDAGRLTAHSQECAGRMAVLMRAGRPDQLMRIAARLGLVDLDALDPDHEAYASLRDVMRAHVAGVEPK